MDDDRGVENKLVIRRKRRNEVFNEPEEQGDDDDALGERFTFSAFLVDDEGTRDAPEHDEAADDPEELFERRSVKGYAKDF